MFRYNEYLLGLVKRVRSSAEKRRELHLLKHFLHDIPLFFGVFMSYKGR